MARRGKWGVKMLAIVEAMWLHGETSEAGIAIQVTRSKFCGAITRGQVSGMINRMGIRNLTVEQRQARLDEIKKARPDGGLLPERCFTIRVTQR